MSRKKRLPQIAFTIDAALKIKPPAKGWIYRRVKDAKHVTVGVSATGTRAWVWYGKRKGERAPSRIKIGPIPEMFAEQARVKAARLTAENSETGDKAKLDAIAHSDMVLGDLFCAFLKNRRTRRGFLSAKSVANYESWWRVYLKRDFGDKPLAAMTRREVAKIHDRIGRTTGTTANRVLVLVQALFSYAKGRGYWDGLNPATVGDSESIEIRLFPEASRERWLQSDELPRFLTAVRAEPNSAVRDAVLLLLATGVRRNNLLSARWKDFHLERGEWRIPVTKSGDAVTIVLAGEAVEVLRSRRRETINSAFVFPGSGVTGHLVDISKGWQRICERGGFDPHDVHLHDLRRTLGGTLANAGASLHVVGQALGQRSPRSTAIYARIGRMTLREAMANAVGSIFAAGAPKAPALTVVAKKAPVVGRIRKRRKR